MVKSKFEVAELLKETAGFLLAFTNASNGGPYRGAAELRHKLLAASDELLKETKDDAYYVEAAKKLEASGRCLKCGGEYGGSFFGGCYCFES